MAYFKLFFTAFMVANIVGWSNEGRDAKTTFEYTAESVWLGLGCCIRLGVDQPPELKMVWNDEFLRPSIARVDLSAQSSIRTTRSRRRSTQRGTQKGSFALDSPAA
jgi:hypothetical protein